MADNLETIEALTDLSTIHERLTSPKCALPNEWMSRMLR